MWRIPTCFQQSGSPLCPDRLFPDVFFGLGLGNLSPFEHNQFAIRCRQSVTFPSRGTRDAAGGVARSMGRPLKAIQVFCRSVSHTLFLVRAGKNTSTTLLTAMMNCLFSHGAKLPTYRHQPFVSFL